MIKNELEITNLISGFKAEIEETEATMERILKPGDWAPNTLIMSGKILIKALEAKYRKK